MEKRTVSAEILCVGTELLLGDIINTNASFIARELTKIGIAMYHQTVVGDNAERLKDAVRCALSRSDILITSGGLGPTYDDITKETVADALGKEMYYDEATAERIHRYFERIGRKMPPSNEKQAMTPVGATVVMNPRGTAPGLIVTGNFEGVEKTVIMLPGPPCELEPMTVESIIPALSRKFNIGERVFFSRNLHFVGIGESSLEEIIRPLMDSKNPTVAPYAGEGEVRLRVTASADNTEQAMNMCDEMIERIKEYGVGKYMYAIDIPTLEETLVRTLTEKGLTFTCAESCTGGLISKRITDVSGASAVFPGGVCSYANEIKAGVLGVKIETLDKYTAVSEQTAKEMADGIRCVMGTDIAVSVTGYAGPGGGTEQDPVGTVYVGVSSNEGTFVKRLSYSSLRDRVFIRRAASSFAMGLALSVIGTGEFDIR